jgi:hypothetical protein
VEQAQRFRLVSAKPLCSISGMPLWQCYICVLWQCYISVLAMLYMCADTTISTTIYTGNGQCYICVLWQCYICVLILLYLLLYIQAMADGGAATVLPFTWACLGGVFLSFLFLFLFSKFFPCFVLGAASISHSYVMPCELVN